MHPLVVMWYCGESCGHMYNHVMLISLRHVMIFIDTRGSVRFNISIHCCTDGEWKDEPESRERAEGV